jgi:hypothetical protein
MWGQGFCDVVSFYYKGYNTYPWQIIVLGVRPHCKIVLYVAAVEIQSTLLLCGC